MSPQFKKGRSSPYQVQYRKLVGGKSVVATKSFTRKEDALDFEEKVRRERRLRAAGMPIPVEDYLITEAMKEFMRHREEEYPAATWKMDGTRLSYWVEKWQGRLIRSLESEEIKTALDELQKEMGFAPATRNRHRALLHTFWNWAIRKKKGAIYNPVSQVELVTEIPTRRGKRLDKKQAKLYIEAAQCHSPWFGLAAIWLLRAGPRVSSLLSLRNEDVDMKNGTFTLRSVWEKASRGVHSRTKGLGEGGEETYPLLPDVVKATEAFKAKWGFTAPKDFVLSRPNGGHYAYENVRAAHKATLALANLPAVTIHDLRRTFASLAEEAGFSKEEIQRMLGHSSILVTQRYTKMDVSHLLEKAKKVRLGK